MAQQIDAVMEERAAEVVNFIQECVQILRTTSEFDLKASTPLITVHLLSRFEHTIPRIKRLAELIPGVVVEGTGICDTEQRHLVVSQVLWPLVACLSQCYKELDGVIATTKAPPGKKPTPPPGLLSIQNYTDIAALTEFLVCTSILPLLEGGILMPADERARHFVPKSLVGRIPRRSLLWGSAGHSTMTIPQVIEELRTTVASIGRVVLLDRFRPMLLPRHLADLHAAVFQADELEKRWLQPPEGIDLVPPQYLHVKHQLLPVRYPTDNTELVLDSYAQARTYQTLLMRGMEAPLWLRKRVSALLTELACHDLPAIVHVFVLAVSSGDMTSASLRLARALTSLSNGSRDAYFAALAQQLLSLLDLPEGVQVNAELDRVHRAGLLTVWAVLDQAALELSMKHIFPLLIQDLLPLPGHDGMDEHIDQYCVHKASRRIGVLLASIPPGYNAWKLSRILMSPVQDLPLTNHSSGTKVTILNQLLRIASIRSAVVLEVKEEATVVLRYAIQMMAQSSFPVRNQPSVGGDEMAALALVYSLASTVLDLDGYRYTTPGGDSSQSGTIQPIILERVPDEGADDSIAMLKSMADVVLNGVLLPLTNRTETEVAGEVGNMAGDEKGSSVLDTDTPSQLPSTLFYLLLACYFSMRQLPDSLRSAGTNTRVGLPSVFRRSRMNFQLAVMLLLPLVCEHCSAQSLLLADGSGSGILRMVKLILDCTSSFLCGPAELTEHTEQGVTDAEASATVTSDATSRPFGSASSLLSEILTLKSGDGYDNAQEDLPFDEGFLSTSSVVLTLTITILELGNQLRPKEEEEILKSMIPTLEQIAHFRHSTARQGKDSLLFQPELAGMAAHAMALIAARTEVYPAETEHIPSGRSERQVLLDTINKAQIDVKSEQPPIRARGVISLSRLAHGYLRAKESQAERPLVEVMDETDNDGSLSQALTDIVRICIDALADQESYVYLAAVQSIVAAADASPREVIPLMAHGICTGTMSFTYTTAGDASGPAKTHLSTEQRIKLTEALLFTIRRRAGAVYEFLPLLMSLLLYGSPLQDNVERTLCSEAQINEETHQFFLQGNGRSHEHEESMDVSHEHKVLRIRTGGPVFQSEESDVVRAGCVMILSELVSSSPATVVARYCRSLMHFAINALNLEPSRPVRRATAILCYELYNAVLVEYNEEATSAVDSSFSSIEKSLAVEMVSAQEDLLNDALRGCMSTTESVGSTSQRLYDPATAVRCQEALNARDAVYRVGVLTAARLYVTSSEQEKLSPVAGIIRARLSEKPDGCNNLTVLKGLEFDANNLGLESDV